MTKPENGLATLREAAGSSFWSEKFNPRQFAWSFRGMIPMIPNRLVASEEGGMRHFLFVPRADLSFVIPISSFT